MSGTLLLDEMYPRLLAEALRDRGHDVVALVETTAGPGIPDEQVLELALVQKRALLTENVGDFETLRVRRLGEGQPCPGLLYGSPYRFPRTKQAIGRLINALDLCLASESLPGPGQVAWLQDQP